MMEQIKLKNSNNETLKAGCVVLNNQNQVLLVSKVGEDVWTFPKGHVEQGESSEEAAIREVLEETGCNVEIVRQLFDICYTKKSTGELVRVVMFLANNFGKVSLAENTTVSKWFSLEDAKNVIFHNLAFLLEEV
jgi:ADP-ribose pyrophosphatase YjhB (NUDIX family)